MRIALVALLLALPAAASAGTLKLGPNFSPNPTVTETFHVRPDDGVYTSDIGFVKCGPGGANTSKTPATTFELTADLTNLRIRLTNGDYQAGIGAILVFPDGKYACEDDHDELFFKSWPKGKYTMYFYGPSIDLAAQLRFEMPTRSTDAVTAAKASLPTVKLGPEGANGGANPAFLPLTATAAAEAGDLGIGCGTDAHDRLFPIANLEVSKKSTYFLKIRGLETFLITADNKCGATGDNLTLEPGTHLLWGITPKDGLPETLTLEADDRERALSFLDAPHQDAGDLSTPLVIDGKVRAAERWPSRDWSCGGTARTPDFYLTSDQPLQKVELSLLWSKHDEHLHLYGPLAKTKVNSIVQCDEGQGSVHFDVLEGTYAVWIGSGQDDATGDDFHVLVRRTDVALDPLKTLTDIPTDLSMSERAYAHFYPFFDPRSEPDWKAIFTLAPDQLFAYTRVATEDGDTKLAAGEPVLLDWSSEDRSAVRRWDGSSASVRTDLLTTDRPATISLPTKPTVPKTDDLSQAEEWSGPEDDKAISTYAKQDEKYTICVGNYLEKHDPTWGTGDDVYRISGNGHVTNVSAEVGKAADRKCGGGKLTKASDKLIKKLATTRAARYKVHLAAVRARFGI